MTDETKHAPAGSPAPAGSDWYDEDDEGCWWCGGRGYVVTCIDDLCRNAEECIHGDGEAPCPECRGSDREFPLGRIGCLFPRECCMPGEHYTSECHTPEDLMDAEDAKAWRRWKRLNRRRWRKESKSPNTTRSATGEKGAQ